MTNMELPGICVLLAALVMSVPHPACSGCENRVCNPRMGNLAVGRPVQTVSQCGSTSPERYCNYETGSCVLHCEVCDASVRHRAHPPTSMTDSPFKHPATWWQSSQETAVETLQLDLEVEFYFTHLIIIFRSPRPAAMAIERSQDFGHTWSALMLYARNCSEVFNLEEGHGCTQKYSTASPCSNGEVIYRALSPWDKLDPYSSDARSHLGITNIRMRLLQPQSCPCQRKLPDANMPPAHYAIYDLILKGGCLCHGHADQCVPAGDQHISHPPSKHMVHGKCVCRHHTAGDHCERCDRLYNDRPWQPANGLTGEAQPCASKRYTSEEAKEKELKKAEKQIKPSSERTGKDQEIKSDSKENQQSPLPDCEGVGGDSVCEGKGSEEVNQQDKTPLSPSQSDHIVGVDYVIPVTGFFCKLCNIFYTDESKAKSEHCRSLEHHNNFKLKHAEVVEPADGHLDG